MKKVAVLIPTQKRELDLFERVALQQVGKILSDFEIIFVMPDSSNAEFVKIIKNAKIERFGDGNFISVGAYSNLMLDVDFYYRFLDYKYILIYQLDAFVFKDCLDIYCNMNYDYIAAPLYSHLLDEVTGDVVVCNGGFSLRKVTACIRVLEKFKNMILGEKYKEDILNAEDVFWAICGQRDDIEFSVPPIEIASRFSMEANFGNCMEILKMGELPFGTHSWIDTNYHLWKPIIEKYGYSLPNVEKVEFEDTTASDVDMWNFYKTIRDYAGWDAEKQKDFLKRINLTEDTVCIYGAGADGKLCLNMLQKLSLTTICFFDKNSRDKEYKGVPIFPPDIEKISKSKLVIIASRAYEIDIVKELEVKKVYDPSRYIFFREIFDYIIHNFHYQMF